MAVYGEKCKGLRGPRMSYSYSNRSPVGLEGKGENDSLKIKLQCPRISSFGWCLRLYSLVLGGLGLLLSFIWVCFQLYVLSQTTNTELRLQRYLDILLGLVLLLSLVCLLYAGYSQSRIWIIAFITASLAVVLTYWCWFLYIKASGMDFPDSEEITGDVLAILSCIYGFILLPVLFFYRSLELAANQAIPIKSQGSYSKRKPPPKYSDEY